MDIAQAASAPPAATRKGSAPIKVYVLPEELASIQAAADSAGLSVSNYLRNLGLGFEPRSVLDHQQVAVLARINADQARLGNLLKMWLADDERLLQYEPVQTRATIILAMQRIKEFQAELRQVVKKL